MYGVEASPQQAVVQYGGWTLLASAFYHYQQQFRRT